MRKSSSQSQQWSFTNNSAAAYSQFLSFKSTKEQGGTHKTYIPGFSQRNLGLDKLGGNQHIVHAHPWQPKDVHISSQTNHLGPFITSSVLSSHLTPNPPTAIGAPPISTNGPVVGSTDLKNAPSISTGPCQLTLFYNGSVCVYDNVSPEKAKAIMLLAGNGDSKNSTSSASASLPSLPKVEPSVKDTAVLNHSAGFSSPVSLPLVHTPFNSVSSVEVNPIKPVIALTPAPVNCPEPPKSATPVGAAGVKLIPSGISSAAPVGASAAKTIQSGSAVPQARKASLARFLEKRKDRVTAAAPYVVNKNSWECSATGASGSTVLMNSASSSPLPASN